MKLVFDPALDGPVWPGPLGDRAAAFGEAWLGPLGMLGLLESQLGLGGRFATPLQRACGLTRSLRSGDGFWRPSFERDPIGTSRRLLRDRDTLTMWGWTGEAASDRLGALGRATRDAADGLPDRLTRVVNALEERAVDIETVTLFSPAGSLEPLWRSVFAAMAKKGVRLLDGHLPTVTSRGDLGRARAPGFLPEGDGSLCLLRRYGALDAADEVAATLAALDDLRGVVVVGGDAVLDRALTRHGLPRLGLDVAVTASSRILPLVLEAAFEPMEAADLHGLLTLDPGPIPRSIATPLVHALRNQPGRRSDAWKDALARALERSDDEKRERLDESLTAILMPGARRGGGLPVESLRRRLEALRTWATARARTVPSLLLVGPQIEALLDAIDLLGAVEMPLNELRRLCSEIQAGAWAESEAEAGLAHVRHPGALLGPADAIVWWSFTRAEVPRPPQIFLTQPEESELRVRGLQVPDFALLMEAEARRWRRSLSLAKKALILVCPQTTETGEPNQPHPLWDELAASLARPDDIHLLVASNLAKVKAARTTSTTLRPLVRPAMDVASGAPIRLRDVESPSSLERLVGCSFSWALHYRGHLRPGIADGPARLDNRLFGSIAHDLLAQVLAARPESPESAARRTAELFDERVPRICEAIDLPAHQVQRATLRRTVVDSARALTDLLSRAGAQVVGTEVSQEATFLGQPVAGRIDLVLARPDFVIDLKWGKTHYVDALENGIVFQLAAYAAMHRESCARPDVGIGYFLLRSQELVTGPRPTLPGGKAPGQHDAQAIWAGALAEVKVRLGELAEGVLRAPGAEGSETESRFDGTNLRLAPNCRYCPFDGLCGRKAAN